MKQLINLSFLAFLLLNGLIINTQDARSKMTNLLWDETGRAWEICICRMVYESRA